MGLPTGQQRAPEVGLVAGFGHHGDIPGIQHQEVQVRQSLLRTDQRQEFGGRVEASPEPALEVARCGPAEIGQPLLESVLAHRGIVDGAMHGITDRLRRWGIVVPRTEVDHVDPLRQQAPLEGGDLRQGIARQALHPAAGHDHWPAPRTGFCSTPTPGISTSTVSPSTSCDTPAGVPVRTRSPGSSVMTVLM